MAQEVKLNKFYLFLLRSAVFEETYYQRYYQVTSVSVSGAMIDAFRITTLSLSASIQ